MLLLLMHDGYCMRLNFNLFGNFQICSFPFPSNDFKELTFLSSISMLLFFSTSHASYIVCKKKCKIYFFSIEFYHAALVLLLMRQNQFESKFIYVTISPLFFAWRIIYLMKLWTKINIFKILFLLNARSTTHNSMMFTWWYRIYHIDEYCLYYICANVQYKHQNIEWAMWSVEIETCSSNTITDTCFV